MTISYAWCLLNANPDAIIAGMTTAYKSSVLRCNVGDDDCLVCQFLAGREDVEAMREVIRILDIKLAEKEELCRKLQKTLIETVNTKEQ